MPVERASTLLSRRDAREFAGTCMCKCRVSEYVLTMLDVGCESAYVGCEKMREDAYVGCEKM